MPRSSAPDAALASILRSQRLLTKTTVREAQPCSPRTVGTTSRRLASPGQTPELRVGSLQGVPTAAARLASIFRAQ